MHGRYCINSSHPYMLESDPLPQSKMVDEARGESERGAALAKSLENHGHGIDLACFFKINDLA